MRRLCGLARQGARACSLLATGPGARRGLPLRSHRRGSARRPPRVVVMHRLAAFSASSVGGAPEDPNQKSEPSPAEEAPKAEAGGEKNPEGEETPEGSAAKPAAEGAPSGMDGLKRMLSLLRDDLQKSPGVKSLLDTLDSSKKKKKEKERETPEGEASESSEAAPEATGARAWMLRLRGVFRKSKPAMPGMEDSRSTMEKMKGHLREAYAQMTNQDEKKSRIFKEEEAAAEDGASAPGPGPSPHPSAPSSSSSSSETAVGSRASPAGPSTEVQRWTGEKNTWEKLKELLSNTPIIDRILKSRDAFNQTKLGETITDAKEFYRQKIETSQHPWVYRVSEIYSEIFEENDTAKAIRLARATDPEFFIENLQEELQQETIPKLVSAFLSSDREVLRSVCSAEGYERFVGIFAQREEQGLTFDPTVLDVGQVDLLAAQPSDRGNPIFVYYAVVQQIDCIRNKEGEIVEGSDDKIANIFYTVAVQQQLSESKHRMEWKVLELGFQNM